jgi:hypothetical protein
MRAMPAAVCAFALIALTQTNPALDAAEKAVSDLRYPDARPLLARARQVQGLDRASLLEILWLQGLVSSSLGQADGARQAFRTLLSIEPEYTPKKEQPPKVMTPFYEARGWVATKKPLRMAPLTPTREAGRVKLIGFNVSADPLSLITGVRIHVAGQPDTTTELVHGTATRDVDGEEVSWWAELIGERDAQLQLLGTAEHPIVDRGVELQPEGAHAQPPQIVIEQPRENPPRPLRTGAFVAVAIGGVSLVTGTVFAALAQSLTSQLKNVTRDNTGAVTGLTERQAFALDYQERTDAILGNTLLALGGVLVALAIALYFAGGS